MNPSSPAASVSAFAGAVRASARPMPPRRTSPASSRRSSLSLHSVILQLRGVVRRALQQVDCGVHPCGDERVQASKSLQEALFQLELIRPEDCTAFLEAWREDQRRFGQLTEVFRGSHRGYPDAFSELGLDRWQEAIFGISQLPLFTAADRAAPDRDFSALPEQGGR
ncbi:hypothetical protein [Actinoplanes sp. NPDC023714]|uniref:hypothetical protein n=1 Tax=Actinoplanes sp. NPDC023714 TaxID=3154322 RepID=UPI00340839CD